MIPQPLFAKQSAPIINGYRYFYFYALVKPGLHEIVTKTIKDGDGFDSLEEALAETVTSSAGEDLESLIMKLKHWINVDFCKGFGCLYPEHEVVAWAGPHDTQKPVVYYEVDGKQKWVTHPQIDLIVQRYQRHQGD